MTATFTTSKSTVRSGTKGSGQRLVSLRTWRPSFVKRLRQTSGGRNWSGMSTAPERSRLAIQSSTFVKISWT